ncbi:hypothetical protein PY254_11100 [Rhodanobacter sp. AS-Z3]|uniref:hypothetical protein n=1 Tax=Rhodanobacter sp. AS-Z3 TaxID=3031330 RepID=UPI002479EF6E|nr:hypothetical protein [Rhodanobacter sp. AS-Z3]WEN13792.1 hypothetical protein PY254_11100 [Rhodanobacter sp. AS-Z3]
MNAPDPLASWRLEVDKMVAKMQTPEAKAGVDRLMAATPEELGAAAVRAAQKERLSPLATMLPESDS